ncbi:cellulose synthase like G3, ARABIDOPSIS THALIANA CELLULOSE SYNTHASE-LIKE G3 [Hibiscus trionum]|uniref:Cellulose synthase like G3, ARABIDOPSIS THALIANA CELLULOSE SYNTHASE-LIKE G3 n=1 Tax=Hibiscus trionum TaxID=183268 RepID=A0A9W7IPS3_HIBTR|nr:cellulose synthase like G3, ARABIDOPSIS THALIANA CELLULOSE SYNTHASE-LIKE G3 [Hibiscus trionum]
MNATRSPPLLNTLTPSRRTGFNRAFAAVYTCAILALFYRHTQTLISSKTLVSFYVTLALSVSDLILAFMWANGQAFRMRPVYRKEFPDNIEKVVNTSDLPGLDVFICTADPYKEPPMSVVNTALSVMAYDYPTDKISLYVSDDGGSAFTLFAFIEAARFAAHWLPYCRENDIAKRSPDEYFATNYSRSSETEKIKLMYESMKMKVKHVVGKGEVSEEYITGDEDREAFRKWSSDGFSRQNHPAVVQVLLDKNKDKDITGHCLPNLVYVSRQKSKTSPHHFKAGALNVLVRVSAAMTNAPVILTLDCDMYSNDPRTPLRAMCYVLDPEIQKNLAYIQFPQEFHGLNKNDIYACENKRLFKVHPVGFDGLSGPNYLGTGCFIRRRALFGDPSTMISPETKDLSLDFVVNQPITAPSVLELAHRVAGCNYENRTKWGSKIGFRYGSLVEDYYTGYHMKCEGWRSVFCYPEKPAFLGDVPFNLLDVLGQNKRWAIGLLEVAFSRYSTIAYGVKAMGLLMGLGYSYYAFWPIYAIPVTTYSYLPQLALLHGVSIFPKVSEPWFLLYMFLFLGAYGQDLLEFVIDGGTIQRWWSDQRMWMMRGLSCYLFGLTEFFLNSIGIPTEGFNVTSKVTDDEQSKRYEQGLFEFRVASPLFVTLATAALINLSSFILGIINFLNGNNREGLLMQLVLTGLIVMNCVPIYQAMVLRSNKGKMPIKTSISGAILASVVYVMASPFSK